jgi:hypothetical protein
MRPTNCKSLSLQIINILVPVIRRVGDAQIAFPETFLPPQTAARTGGISGHLATDVP